MLVFYFCIKDSRKNPYNFKDKILKWLEDNAITSALDNYSQKLRIRCCKPLYETLALRNEIVNGEA